MNNSINAIIELISIELFYESSIHLFLIFNEININDIRFPDIKDYIDRIMESIFIIKDNHIIMKIIQIYNINKSRCSDSIYKIEDMIILDFKNIHHRIKKNGHSIKFYLYFLDLFKIIKKKIQDLEL